MKIYFAGSIRGGRKDAAVYAQLINYLKEFGEVLTEHIGALEERSFYAEDTTDSYIHDRDMEWLLSADIMVAEVSVTSMGVGYETGRAVAAGIPVVCLYRENSDSRLSAMIGGCRHVKVVHYSNLSEAYEELKAVLMKYSSESSQK